MSESPSTKKRRSRLTWVVGGVLGIIALGAIVVVGGTYIYIHFIEGPAPKPLALPKTTSTVPTSSSGAVASPSGQWKPTSASVVGYRVNEVLFGQNNVAVGRTNAVTGSMTVNGTDVTNADFTVQMADVHSDQSQRDNQFDGRIMNVAQYPTATFSLTSPISSGAVPAVSATVHESATGNLTLHGRTHSVTFPVSARYSGSTIDVTGSIPITFADWGISNPGFGGQITTDNHGTLEFLLVLSRALRRSRRFTPRRQQTLTQVQSESITMSDMTLVAPPEPGVDPRRIPLDVEIAIPVYNEAEHLAERIIELRRFLDESFPFRALVTIVDNASTDDTLVVARRLADTVSGVTCLHLPQKGRGLALRSAWSTSTAPVVAYMDVDLVDFALRAGPAGRTAALGAFRHCHWDQAGPRRPCRARTKRELISRAYNLLLKLSLRGRFSDAQRGFKALRREVAEQLLPLVQDDEWFFDTELLVTAERLGLRMSEVPVEWVDDPDSRVKIIQTAVNDLRGVWRISHGKARQLAHRAPTSIDQVTADQLFRFAGVGVVSTIGYLFLFLAWRPIAGTYLANALALAICTIFNLAVHKELARSMQGRGQRGRFALVAASLFLLSLALTSLALYVVQVAFGSSLSVDLLAVTVANAIAAVLRFSVLRAWVFRPRPSLHKDSLEVSQ